MRRPRRCRDVFGPPRRDGGDLGFVGPVGQGVPGLALREQGGRLRGRGKLCAGGRLCGGRLRGRGERRDRDGYRDRRTDRAQAGLNQVSDQLQGLVERVAVPPGQVANGGEPVELPGDRPLLVPDHGPGTRHPVQLRTAFGGDLAAGQPFGLPLDVGPDRGDVEAEQRSDPVRPARPEPDADLRSGRPRQAQRDERVQGHGPEQIPQLTPADDVAAHQQGTDAAVVLVAGNYAVPPVDCYPLRADKAGPQVGDRR